jgi:hypothetical protein
MNTIYVWPLWHDHIAAPAIVHDEDYWQRQREEQAQLRQRNVDMLQQRTAAKERARELLTQHLTPLQRETMERNGWFVIEGGKSGSLYRVHADRVAGNVELLDEAGKKAVASFCCHLDHSYPTHDHHLAQKLILEWDEDAFLSTANRRQLAA